MGNRRFAQIATSDDEEDDFARQSQQSSEEVPASTRKRKLKRVAEEEEEEERRRSRKKKKKGEEDAETASEGEEEEEEEEDEEDELEAKPIGEMVKISGKGRTRRQHYQAFEYDGNQYELEDPVLLTPSDRREKPYVAIIKDITQLKDGNMVVLGQWFYRPEEAEKKGGGNWQSQDTRELFYSFHRDECPAESVMHKCVVHFVPLHKQLPKRKEHPGFIVQKVYDTDGKKLWKLTDRDYEEDKQHEIDLLVQKTMRRLVDLPDIEIGDPTTNQDDQLKSKRNLIKKNIAPLDVSRVEEATTRPGKIQKPETPGSCMTNSSEYHRILVELNALTGDTHRDKWLEKLIKELQFICSSTDSMNGGDKRKCGSDETDCKSPDVANGRQDTNLKGGKPFHWPDDAVRAATALEKASHDSLSSDYQKYNQKLRSLSYNLSKQVVLARRLLSGELEPSTILNMSPDELKEGLTAEERAMKEPDESERMQMTDARCTRCSELKVGVRNIIQAGHGARYELECTACGNMWYAARDAVSMLTIDTPSSNKNVGTVPLATAKFEDVEKKLVSPRESDKTAAPETIKKTTEAYMPILEAQRSFGKSKREENSESAKNAE
ncbi:putative BAH domain, transcription elongation factor S-II, central domain-containing protein [Rosa chinensis]|uniref:Putative BAH domain, transcription elongation factor S-II, central domain-containing protein n=1 Tax=Rosa chinensis TaxID=74649 RepID=A0A2P6P6X5_ROSCH|nr:AT-rich interactive domain-containing protein 4B [Rosa chinensis]PRQ17687.1 putative BAH domain, transcription elongation factor S-II, central domain-containing protein [Rosa chinensis]